MWGWVGTCGILQGSVLDLSVECASALSRVIYLQCVHIFLCVYSSEMHAKKGNVFRQAYITE